SPATPRLLLSDARPFPEPVVVRGGRRGKRATHAAFSGRANGPARTRHDPPVRFRVAVAEGETRRAVVVGRRQVAPGQLIQTVHEETVVDRVRMFVEK